MVAISLGPVLKLVDMESFDEHVCRGSSRLAVRSVVGIDWLRDLELLKTREA
jgi:hypothetical protein